MAFRPRIGLVARLVRICSVLVTLVGFSGCGKTDSSDHQVLSQPLTSASPDLRSTDAATATTIDAPTVVSANSEPVEVSEPNATASSEPVAGVELTADVTAPVKKPADQAKPLFDGWGTPAVAFVLSGEQHGYFEPCGCSENQSGGVSRRHDLVKKLLDKGWTLTGLDLGGTVSRNRAQTKLKLQTFLAAMKDMKYSVLNLGPEELKIGAAELLAYHSPDDKVEHSGLGFVSANVTLFNTPELGTPIRGKLLTFGKLKVGVTGILGPSFRNDITPEGANTDIVIGDLEPALNAVLKSWDSQVPSLRILLSHGTMAESKALAKKFPHFDLVLTSGGAEDPEFDNPQKIGNTLLVQVGHKGKYTGVVGYFPDNPKEKLRFEHIKLSADRFGDSPKMIEHMRLYQDLLKAENLAVTEPPIKHPSGATFVGSEKCGECHSKAFEVWKESGHAHAYDSLINGRPELKNRWVSRIHDPECLSCHVTGWHAQDVLRYVSGFESKEKTPHLLHNGCENCHGPGSKHIELLDNDKNAARKAVRLTLEEAKKTQCYTCHDLDNSPKFKFEEYWEKIKHKGLD